MGYIAAPNARQNDRYWGARQIPILPVWERQVPVPPVRPRTRVPHLPQIMARPGTAGEGADDPEKIEWPPRRRKTQPVPGRRGRTRHSQKQDSALQRDSMRLRSTRQAAHSTQSAQLLSLGNFGEKHKKKKKRDCGHTRRLDCPRTGTTTRKTAAEREALRPATVTMPTPGPIPAQPLTTRRR